MAELRKYNTATEIYFPLVTFGESDFDTTIDGSNDVFVLGDVQYSIDGTSFTNSNVLPEHIGNGMYKLELTAAELLGSNIIITIKSQDDPKKWEDQGVNISTYGNASAGIVFDLGSSFETQLTAVLMSDLAQGAPSATASIVYAINFLYELGRNRAVTSGTELAIYKDDGTTKAFKGNIYDNGTEFIKSELGSGA